MLDVSSVTHRYGSRTALDDVSLTIARGEFFGLLGPNGAGKTTLMSLVSGLRAPGAGRLTLDGAALGPDAHPSTRLQLGLVPQHLALYDELTAEENLRVFGALYGLRGATLGERIDEGLAAVQLADRRRDRVKTFSGGMQRRLNLVAALLHRPALLLCDEPTVGVDPQSRSAIFDFLQARNRAGLTVIYSTHYMEEATRLCTRIGIIDHGRLLALGTLAELLARAPAGEAVRIARSPAADAALPALAACGETHTTDDAHTVKLAADVPLSRFFATAEGLGLPAAAFTLARPSLEDVFLQLTGRALRDA